MATDKGAALRPELTELPQRMKGLPVESRGYPVPRFVEWIGGEPDFRIMSAEHWRRCVREDICWVCGQRLGVHKAFVAGPMCLINLTSAEPPSHLECARWSAINCPFLTRPHMRRREDEITAVTITAGEAILRNPGVTAVIVTRGYKVWKTDALIAIGEPEAVEWYAEGRRATRDEVSESIESGYPALREIAERNNETEDLKTKRRDAETWLPA